MDLSNFIKTLDILVLIDYSYCDKIGDKIKYLISEKKVITYRVDSYHSLPIGKNINFL